MSLCVTLCGPGGEPAGLGRLAGYACGCAMCPEAYTVLMDMCVCLHVQYSLTYVATDGLKTVKSEGPGYCWGNELSNTWRCNRFTHIHRISKIWPELMRQDGDSKFPDDPHKDSHAGNLTSGQGVKDPTKRCLNHSVNRLTSSIHLVYI